MGLPTIEKTWVHTQVNQSLSAGTDDDLAKLTMYSFKASMVALGWTVRGSSNASTANTSDNWASAASCVWNQVDPRSWIVLRNETCDIEVCIDLHDNNVAFADVAFSRAGFSGFTSTTARPTATDEKVVYSDGFWGHNSGAAKCALHVLATNDTGGPENTYVFFVHQNPGTETSCWIISKVSTTHNDAGNPVYFFTSSTYDTSAPRLDELYETYARNNLWKGDDNYETVSCTAQGFGLDNDRVVEDASGAPSDLDSGYPLDQVGIFCRDSGARGKVGYIKDLWWAYSTHLTGDTYPSTANTYAKFGAVAVPWGNSSTPDLGV